MNVVAIVGVVAALAILILLGFVLMKISALQEAVAELKTVKRAAPAAEPNGDLHLVMELAKRVGDTQTKFGEIGNKLSSLQLQITEVTNGNQTIAQFLTDELAPNLGAKAAARSGQEAPPSPFVIREVGAPDILTKPSVLTEPVSTLSTSDEPVVEAEPEGSPIDRRAETLEAYRNLIAQPRKSDINRWADDVGGLVCEANDDGGFQTLSREAGGLLVLVPINDSLAIVVPSGRLVVDFATSYANVIAMRTITKNVFELTQDGTGVLRLIEPAIAKRNGETWRLVEAGQLAGLKAD